MAWKYNCALACGLAYGLAVSGVASAQTVLSPRIVKERILAEGRESKRIDLDEQGSYTSLYNFLGRYDFTANARGSYEDSRIRYLSGSGNLRDINTIFSAGASKRFGSGTTLGLTFSRTHQDSVLRTAANLGGRNPFIVYDIGEFTVTQDLLGNFLGWAERQQRRAAELGVEAAAYSAAERKENLVADTLRLYWSAFVARETLREANFQKDKYEALVKEIETKQKLSFVMPADLPKARAEYGARVRNVQSATYEYVRNIDLLFTALRLQDADRDVRFEDVDTLPPVPTMVMPTVDHLRGVEAAAKNFENAELTLKATERTNSMPELRLTGAAALTGLQPTDGNALSELGTKNYPRYGVALDLSYRFGSDTFRGAINQARVNSDQSFNTLEQQKENQRQQIATAMEQVRFTYAAAVSAIAELQSWEQAVQAQERTFRQGRVDFSQLILDYNSYYQARSTRIQAIGNYQTALLTYSASVDELLKN